MILLIKNPEDLNWYVDDTWSAVEFQIDNNKKAVMDWLHGTCRHDVVVSQLNEVVASATTPTTTTSVINPGSTWGMSLFPRYEIVYEAHFSDAGEAMMFKLAWGG